MMRMSEGFNDRYLSYLKNAFKYVALYDVQMNQITSWVPIRMPGGVTEFGIAPFDCQPYYYGTWDGHNIMTLMFNKLDYGLTLKEGNSITVNLDLSFEGRSVLGEYDYDDPFLQ